MRVSLNVTTFFLLISFFLHSTIIISVTPSEHISIKNKADIIIYSFDRPAQLFALLESIEQLVTHIGEIHVIYRASNQRFDQAYNTVNQYFKSVHFIQQKTSPNNFKTVTLQSLGSLHADYILFAVDDIIIIDNIDLSDCIKCLEETHAYGFYLRLGKNITFHYQSNQQLPQPPLTPIISKIYQWCFKNGTRYWGYPNTLDMTLYRKSDVAILATLPFQTPNQLESQWHMHSHTIMHRIGLCYEHSKIVNIPLNKVQHDCNNNRSMDQLTPQTLLEYFEKGLKIDIKSLMCINNNSPHMELVPTFISRE